MALQKLTQRVQKDWLKVNQLIDRYLYADMPLANQIAQYIKTNMGKRIRPLLVLLSANAFSCQSPLRVSYAASIELLHNASLLHDDVIDESELRRGKEAVHKRWNNKLSILMGDLLIARALQVLVNSNRSEQYKHSRMMSQFIAQAAGQVIEGEVMQLANIGNAHFTEASYLKMIEKKTAKLFAASAMMGPFLSQGTEENMKCMQAFGVFIGIAFQLIDDVLDYTGDEREIGKRVGQDLKEGKWTLPLIVAFKKGDKRQKECIQQALLSKNSKDVLAVQNVVEAVGAIEYTARLSFSYRDQALAMLDRVSQRIDKTGLEEFACFIVERSK
ncbi:MAG: polyprenyl synthetase family protein [Pseudomonadota bacterium]